MHADVMRIGCKRSRQSRESLGMYSSGVEETVMRFARIRRWLCYGVLCFVVRPGVI